MHVAGTGTSSHIAIIGAGIGGLHAAARLQQRGWRVEVYERAPELGEVGAGLTIWPNALTVLDTIGAADDVVGRGARLRELYLVDSTDRVLQSYNVEDATRQFGWPGVCIHRADLLDVIVQHVAPETIHTSKEVVRVLDFDDRPRIEFADGSRCRADVVVGADGLHSRVRASTLDTTPPDYAGYYCYRGIANIPCGSTDDGVFATFRGGQFGFFPLGQDRGYYWFLCRNGPSGASGHLAERVEELPQFKSELPAAFTEALAATPTDEIIVTDIFDRPVPRVWGRGNVSLLGDAAHPMTPNQGQGACMAIEDGLVLANSLERESSYVSALRSYEKQRRRRTARVVAASRQNGRFLQLENQVLRSMRDLFLELPGVERLSRWMLFWPFDGIDD